MCICLFVFRSLCSGHCVSQITGSSMELFFWWWERGVWLVVAARPRPPALGGYSVFVDSESNQPPALSHPPISPVRSGDHLVGILLLLMGLCSNPAFLFFAVRCGLGFLKTTILRCACPHTMFTRFCLTGNRDIVGFGINGQITYEELVDRPYPAVRFKENTADIIALREKAKGDWKLLSVDEKKQCRFLKHSHFENCTATSQSTFALVDVHEHGISQRQADTSISQAFHLALQCTERISAKQWRKWVHQQGNGVRCCLDVSSQLVSLDWSFVTFTRSVGELVSVRACCGSFSECAENGALHLFHISDCSVRTKASFCCEGLADGSDRELGQA